MTPGPHISHASYVVRILDGNVNIRTFDFRKLK